MKRFFLTIAICFSLFIMFIFMANGYGLLSTELNIEGSSSINLPSMWNPELEFMQTLKMGNVFFYNIILHNNTEQKCRKWKLQIQETDYITFPYSFNGVKENNEWIIEKYGEDNIINPKESAIVSISFAVDENISNLMTTQEYAEYFINNFIKAVAFSNEEEEFNGYNISNGNAHLTISNSEQEIKNYTIEKNKNYTSEIPNEKQYILTIFNNSDKEYRNVRGNIYIGDKNELYEISPVEITYKHSNNVTFELPNWLEFTKDEQVSIYIMIVTQDENFIPEIVLCTKQ